jgi:hypothetical protein
MPITVRCACGASLVVPAAEPEGDVELLDDEPEVVVGVVKPAGTAPEKAAVAAKPAAAVVGQPQPTAPKKRKKKKKRPPGEPVDEVERVKAVEARVQRTVTATLYIVLGVVIVGGAAYMWFAQRENVLEAAGAQGPIGLVVLAVFGLAAVGKGIFGLVFGRFLESDDD